MVGPGANGEAVVIPAVGAASATACVRSLGRRSIHTVAVSEAETPPAFCSRYCDEALPVAAPGEDLLAYRDDLLELARRPAVKTVVPLREPDVYVLSKYRSDFADEVGVVWPAFDALRTVHDRRRLFARAADLDVPVPETSLLSEVEDWTRERIVKGRYAVLTSEFVDGADDREFDTPPKTVYLEPGDRPDVAALRAEMGHDPIAQEYVRGTEYTVRALYDEGEPVVTTQKRLVRGYKYPRGPSVTHEAVRIPELESVATRLLSGLDWHGMASVGFIRDDESGAFKLLEINPRFPASLAMDLHAGVDYPYYYWQLATGTREGIEPAYEPGTVSHLLRGELVHLHSVAFENYPLAEKPSLHGTLWGMASSLYRHPRFDYLSLDDPGPFARDSLNALQSTLEGTL